jgi:hypothetical protein
MFKHAPIRDKQSLTIRVSFVCVDAGFSGGCATFHGSSGQCVNFGSTLNDRISSFGPDADQDYFIFL